MENLLEYLQKEWSVISKAPFAFLILAAIMFGLVYLAASWRYTSVIDQVKTANETLRERLHLKSEQAESYKERALKFDAKLIEIVDASSVSLKNNVLELVKKIRDFVERYQKEERAIQEREWEDMRNAKSDEDKKNLWLKFTNSSLRLSHEISAEYDRRFKIDAILFRDEMLSRLKDYKPPEHNNMRYEYPTN